jgi:uncharacterized protein (DUF983 family)
MVQAHEPIPPGISLGLWRAFRGRCPNCGKGRLYTSYLKQVDACPACGETYADIQADDGPAWFVMLITGAIVVPVSLVLAIHDVMAEWAVIPVMLVLTAALALWMLPRAKGLFLANLWWLRKFKHMDPSG